MSGVYIKGMAFPETCEKCKLFTLTLRCKATGFPFISPENKERRMYDCPLIPIPNHGRLIDADALPWEKQGLLEADEDWALPCSIIEQAPTIIPADKDAE